MLNPPRLLYAARRLFESDGGCVHVGAGMCVCVCACAVKTPTVPHLPQWRREIFIWPLGASGVSEFLTSLSLPVPTPGLAPSILCTGSGLALGF